MRTGLWTRFVSVALSIALSCTMFNAGGGIRAFANENTSATPSVEQPGGSGDAPATTPPSPDAGTAPDTSADNAEAAPGTDAPSSDVAPPPAEAPAEAPTDPSSPPREQAPVDTSVQPTLPGLVPPDEVLPQITGGTADVGKRLAPSLKVADAPQNDDGASFVKEGRARIELDLGALERSLEGGYVAGSQPGDAFIATLDVPYLYSDGNGAVQTTLSAEDWQQADTRKAGMRAALFATGIPQGWEMYAQRAEGYLPLTADDLAAGISGRLVLRYVGNQGRLTADAALPVFQAGFVGDVPEAQQAAIALGYEAHSFTTRDGVVERGDAEAAQADSTVLQNSKSAAQLNVQASLVGAPTLGPDGGLLAYQVAYAVPADAPAATALQLVLSDPTDWQNEQGVRVESLMAKRVGAQGSAEDNVGSSGNVDVSQQARERYEFIGVPGVAGAVVLDVTNLSDQQLVGLDASDASSLERLNVKPLPYRVTKDGSLAVQRTSSDGDGIAAGQTRKLYVALPYAPDACKVSDGDPSTCVPPMSPLTHLQACRSMATPSASPGILTRTRRSR